MRKFLPAAAPAFALAVATALPAAASADVVSARGVFGAEEIGLVEFTLGAGGTYLDLTSNGSLDFGTTTGADTEIALYAGWGSTATYVASLDTTSGGDDDDGIGLNGALSYGTGSGLLLGDSFNLGGNGLAEGEDGAMVAAGDYTLVIGEFSTNFLSGGPTIGDIFDFGDEVTDYRATIYSDANLTLNTAAVPEPATFALTLAAACGGLWRTRRVRAAAA